MTRMNNPSIALFGYSGGGAIAALVAARRDDVGSLVTVAGNLDHVAWTSLHKVSPLHGSLNPAAAATSLRNLPQVHFVGGDDAIVPPSIAESYRARIPESERVAIEVIAGYGHRCCWENDWPDLLCRQTSLNVEYCQ